jgi:DNA-binding transcriptional regulator YiaG
MECLILTCDHPAAKRGWCIRHYKRWQRHGDPEAGQALREPGRTCKAKDCEEPAKRLGWCFRHYHRHLGGKDPDEPTWHDKTLTERFWEKVDKNGPAPAWRPELGPCWVWVRGKTGAGYGTFGIGGGEIELAHRWSYMTEVGPIPEGTELDHLCRNRACVRPDHLDPVSHGTNMKRSPIVPSTINAGKAFCDSGHEFTPENTRIKADGARECKECRRDITRRFRARERAKLPPVETLTAEQDAELAGWVTAGRARVLREAAGMQLLDVARAMSVGSKSTVSRWELGLATPSGELAVKYYGFLADLNRQQAA